MPMSEDDLHRIYAAVTPDIAAVLHLLAKRYNRPEIADATGFSPSTVRNYIERIEDLTKLDQRGLRDFWAERRRRRLHGLAGGAPGARDRGDGCLSRYVAVRSWRPQIWGRATPIFWVCAYPILGVRVSCVGPGAGV